MEKPISATTTTKRRTSSETSTNNSKPINSQIDQQQILDFIQNYRKKRDEIQAAEDKFNYITRTEAKNEFLRTKNIEKNISINDLNSKCKKLKHQVQLLNSKLQQKSFEQKYMLSSVANIKEKQRHIKNHTGWYANYIDSKKRIYCAETEPITERRKQLINQVSATLFSVGVMFAPNISAKPENSNNNHHHSTDSDNFGSPTIPRSTGLVFHVPPTLQNFEQIPTLTTSTSLFPLSPSTSTKNPSSSSKNYVNEIGDAIDWQLEAPGDRWRKTKRNALPPSVNIAGMRVRSRSRGKNENARDLSFLPPDIESSGEIILDRDRNYNEKSQKYDAQKSCNSQKSLNSQKSYNSQKSETPVMQKNRYIINPETCYNNFSIELHRCRQQELQCKSEIDHMVNDWEIEKGAGKDLDDPEIYWSGQKTRFYKLEAILWHTTQYLNCLSDICLKRDPHFNLEIQTLGRLRKLAKKERETHHSLDDVAQVLDDTLSVDTMEFLSNRLTSRISGWLLNERWVSKTLDFNENLESLEDTGSLVLQTHHDLLANCDLLTGRLLGREDDLNNCEFGNMGEIGSGPSSNAGSFLLMSRIVKDEKNRKKEETGNILNTRGEFPSDSSSDSSSFLETRRGDVSRTYSGNIVQNAVNRKIVQENISSDKVKTFISCDRTDMVHVTHASDDEQLKRALPWSSLSSLAIHGFEGFEAVSIDEFQMSASDRNSYSHNESVASSSFQENSYFSTFKSLTRNLSFR